MCQCDGTLWRCVSVWRWEVIPVSVTWITFFPSCLSTDGNSRISSIRATADRARQDNLIQQKNSSEKETGDIYEQNYTDSRLSRRGKQINLTTRHSLNKFESGAQSGIQTLLLSFFFFGSKFSLEVIGIVEAWLLSRSNSEYLWACYSSFFVCSIIVKVIVL